MKKKNIGLGIVLALVVIMLVTYVKQQIEDNQEIATGTVGTEVELKSEVLGLNKGETPPDFTLTKLDGEEVTLSELKGKKVVLNFWATWCPPCKAEMPHMQKYYEDQAEDANVEILAVNLTYSEKAVKNVQSFINSYDITFPIALDADDEIGKLYEVLTIPSTYFIDSQGNVQHRVIGPVDEQKIEEFMDNMK